MQTQTSAASLTGTLDALRPLVGRRTESAGEDAWSATSARATALNRATRDNYTHWLQCAHTVISDVMRRLLRLNDPWATDAIVNALADDAACAAAAELGRRGCLRPDGAGTPEDWVWLPNGTATVDQVARLYYDRAHVLPWELASLDTRRPALRKARRAIETVRAYSATARPTAAAQLPSP